MNVVTGVVVELESPGVRVSVVVDDDVVHALAWMNVEFCCSGCLV